MRGNNVNLILHILVTLGTLFLIRVLVTSFWDLKSLGRDSFDKNKLVGNKKLPETMEYDKYYINCMKKKVEQLPSLYRREAYTPTILNRPYYKEITQDCKKETGEFYTNRGYEASVQEEIFGWLEEERLDLLRFYEERKERLEKKIKELENGNLNVSTKEGMENSRFRSALKNDLSETEPKINFLNDSKSSEVWQNIDTSNGLWSEGVKDCYRVTDKEFYSSENNKENLPKERSETHKKTTGNRGENPKKIELNKLYNRLYKNLINKIKTYDEMCRGHRKGIKDEPTGEFAEVAKRQLKSMEKELKLLKDTHANWKHFIVSRGSKKISRREYVDGVFRVISKLKEESQQGLISYVCYFHNFETRFSEDYKSIANGDDQKNRLKHNEL